MKRSRVSGCPYELVIEPLGESHRMTISMPLTWSGGEAEGCILGQSGRQVNPITR